MPDTLTDFPTDWSRGLAVVAHPDDVEFGAAPAVARWTTDGHDIAYLLVTRGEAGIAGMEPSKCGPTREAEQRRAASEIGVKHVSFLDGYTDGTIGPDTGLRRDLAWAIREHRPDVLITFNHHDRWASGAWNTADHRVVGRAALDAVADAANEWIFRDADDGLHPWRVPRIAIAGSPQPTHAVAVDDDTRERAVQSLAAHEAYLRGLGDDPPEKRARFIVESLVASTAPRFDGQCGVSFELIG